MENKLKIPQRKSFLVRYLFRLGLFCWCTGLIYLVTFMASRNGRILPGSFYYESSTPHHAIFFFVAGATVFALSAIAHLTRRKN
jgi:hypothetical protein